MSPRLFALALLAVLSGCSLPWSQTAETPVAERYCYRSLAEIVCFTEPDPGASPLNRVP